MPRVGETAEERLHMLARGWLAYPVTLVHAQLPPKSGCKEMLVEGNVLEVRHCLWPTEIKKAATFQRLLCDPGEARTLDPMIKSHLLYQLSYGVNVLLISVAKVMPFFYPTKFSGYFFQKN